MQQKTVFSGIQPSGVGITIGNYLGALRNWTRLQDGYDAIYCVVDHHALTVEYDPKSFRQRRIDTARVLMAVGIDPSRSLLYYQSDVPAHVELAWMLATITSLGQLNRMTQFKEKADKGGENLGLYSYPVLMAADILVHKAHFVPVGEDQTQHLEVTRDLAQRFNSRFGEEFPIPEQITPDRGARVMSLKSPTDKMSKSDDDASASVYLTDTPDEIRAKLKTAVTDSGHEVAYDREKKPGIANLLDILALFTDRSIDDLVAEYHDMQYGYFKQVVAEAVVEGLAPFRSTYESISDDHVREVMKEGAATANERADRSMRTVREKMGF